MKKFTLIRSEVVPMLITETVEIEANDLKEIYLSGGQVVTLDLKDNPIDSDSLANTLGFDGGYWDTLYSKDNNPTNLCKSNLKSEVKSTYNPYE